jgi:hypothetical protein
MSEEKMENSRCAASIPAANPSQVFLYRIGSREPHCCLPRLAILNERVHECKESEQKSTI